MKKVLVFGASGETGRYFVDYFLEHDVNHEYELIAVGNRKTSFFEEYFHIPYIQMNIVNKEEFAKLPKEDVHAVVDLAGYMPARSDGDYTEKMLNVNLMGTLNILNYCVEVKADRILFAQSFGDILPHAANYPTLTINLPRTFGMNTDHTVYLIAKCAAVDLIEYYHQHYGLKRFIFRLPTIYLYAKDRYFYRDGQKTTLWYRVLIDKAIAGEDMEVWGDPTKVKDMVYVKDFAQLLYLGTIIDRNSGFYNVGTGVGTSLKEQFEVMAEVLGGEKKSKISYRPDMPSTGEYVMDITPAVKELGYKPQYDYKRFLLDYRKEMESGRFDSL